MHKVSVIMPTAGRVNFLPRALAYYDRQHYPNKELLLIVDGVDVTTRNYLLEQPIRPDIHIIHAPGKQTIGAKRNLGCEKATGDIILHMDDDDWYAPTWIGRSVAALIESKAECVGLNDVWFVRPYTELYKFTLPKWEQKNWLCGATLCYWLSAWVGNKFDPIQVGEDAHFVWKCKNKQAHSYTDGFVSILHARNTSPKYVNDPAWQRVADVGRIRSVLGEDYVKYLGK